MEKSVPSSIGLRSHAIGIACNTYWVVEIELLNFQSQPLNKKLLKKFKKQKVKNLSEEKKKLQPIQYFWVLHEISIQLYGALAAKKEEEGFMWHWSCHHLLVVGWCMCVCVYDMLGDVMLVLIIVRTECVT
jgi:hypothetical protein